MRWKWLWLVLSLVAIAGVWGGLSWAETRRCERELDQAKGEMAGGLHHLARQRLADLAPRRPSWGEAAYLLGACEESLGHPQAAETAWSRVEADSPFAAKAVLGRVRILTNAGRFSPAEELLNSLAGNHGPDALQVRQTHEHLLRLEGRVQEARELIVDSWEGAPDPAFVLRRLYILEDAAFPLDYVKNSLAAADQKDDRVWLGKANLAIWTGQLGEAARWLDACQERRPDDQPGLAGPAGIGRCDPRRRPCATSTRPGQCAVVLAVRGPAASRLARLLRRGSGRRASSSEGSRRTRSPATPTHGPVWRRLPWRPGIALLGESFRKKQTEATILRERYTKLIMSNDKSSHIDELRRIAEQLGRRIEARGWSLIQEGRAGSEPLRSPQELQDRPQRSNETLASFVSDLPAGTTHPQRPGVGGRGRNHARFP